MNNQEALNSISIRVDLEAEETLNKLEKIKQLLIDINEIIIEAGIDLGEEKDYTTVATYENGQLTKEETIKYK